jgi:hypothetical protein
MAYRNRLVIGKMEADKVTKMFPECSLNVP